MVFLKPIRLTSTLNRKKVDPNSFIFTGHTHTVPIDIQLFTYSKDECIEKTQMSTTDISAFKDGDLRNWLNIFGLHDTNQIASICKTQDIHNLVIQDILDVNQRPKFQDYDNVSFLTLKSIVTSNNEIRTEQISFVFRPNYLISFQEKKADYFEHLRQRLRENKGILRERNADYLLYTMLESILDNYFKTLTKLEDDIEVYNFTDAKQDPSPDVLGIIEKQKKFAHFIKKSVLPIKEFTQVVDRGECQFVEQSHVKYFLEIKDLCLTLIDHCDMILASLESTTNLFFSVQGHRMNQVMKTLTIVSTIFIPLTFIAGVYGMNFIHMPELEWTYGYIGVWLIFIFVLLLMVVYFKRKKWF